MSKSCPQVFFSLVNCVLTDTLSLWPASLAPRAWLQRNRGRKNLMVETPSLKCIRVLKNKVKLVVDTFCFQRMRFIKQLGICANVYPGLSQGPGAEGSGFSFSGVSSKAISRFSDKRAKYVFVYLRCRPSVGLPKMPVLWRARFGKTVNIEERYFSGD